MAEEDTTTPATGNTDVSALMPLIMMLASRSNEFSGLPKVLQGRLNKVLTGKRMKNYLGRQENSFKDLENAPQFIENQRKSLIDQYQADVQKPFMDMVSGNINSLAGKGVLDSSVAGRAISGVGEEGLRQIATTGRQANQYAAGANLEGLYKKFGASSQMLQNLTSLLGQARYGSGSSNNPAAGLPFIL